MKCAAEHSFNRTFLHKPHAGSARRAACITRPGWNDACSRAAAEKEKAAADAGGTAATDDAVSSEVGPLLGVDVFGRTRGGGVGLAPGLAPGLAGGSDALFLTVPHQCMLLEANALESTRLVARMDGPSASPDCQSASPDCPSASPD